MAKIMRQAIKLKIPFMVSIKMKVWNGIMKTKSPSHSSSDFDQRSLALVNQTAMNLMQV